MSGTGRGAAPSAAWRRHGASAALTELLLNPWNILALLFFLVLYTGSTFT